MFQIGASNFKSQTREIPFKKGDEILSNKTIRITLIDKGVEVNSKKYAFIEKDVIYGKIERGEDINLDNCYVKDFSLEEYRKERNIADREYVELKNFSAIHTFFESEKSTDFSFAKFPDTDVNFQDSIFTFGNTNFYKADFGEGKINFENVNFGIGDVNFQFAKMDKGDAVFDKTVFFGEMTSFVNTNFGNGKVDFKEAYFGKGKVNFHFAKFGKGNKSFEKAEFHGDSVDFRRIEFGEGRIDFRRINFGNSEVLFDESEITKGKLSFRSSIFGSRDVSFEMFNFGADEANFERVEFGSGNVSFSKAKGTKLNMNGAHFNGYVNLRVENIKHIDLSETLIRDIIDVAPVSEPVKIEQLNIRGIRNLGRMFIDWNKNNVYDLIANQEETTLMEKAEQFRTLKEDFNSNGEYDDEDKAYVEFKRFELKATLEKAKKIGGTTYYKQLIVSFFQDLIFDKMGLYATNPLRVLGSMFVVFSLYSVIYTILPFFTNSSISCPGVDESTSFFLRMGNMFYYSAITFLTIGYGDCLPNGLFKWLAPLEGWMGVFLMSYFTVAFVRKILR